LGEEGGARALGVGFGNAEIGFSLLKVGREGIKFHLEVAAAFTEVFQAQFGDRGIIMIFENRAVAGQDALRVDRAFGSQVAALRVIRKVPDKKVRGKRKENGGGITSQRAGDESR